MRRRCSQCAGAFGKPGRQHQKQKRGYVRRLSLGRDGVLRPLRAYFIIPPFKPVDVNESTIRGRWKSRVFC